MSPTKRSISPSLNATTSQWAVSPLLQEKSAGSSSTDSIIGSAAGAEAFGIALGVTSVLGLALAASSLRRFKKGNVQKAHSYQQPQSPLAFRRSSDFQRKNPLYVSKEASLQRSPKS